MYSEELLKQALKEDKVVDFLRGTNGYKIMNPNGVQENLLMQNYGNVIDTFHDLNVTNPEYNLPQVLHDKVYLLLESDDSIDIYTVMNILDAELFKEKFPSASFKLSDVANMLLILKNQLIKNKNKLSTTILNGDPMSIWELSQMYLSGSLSDNNLNK